MSYFLNFEGVKGSKNIVFNFSTHSVVIIAKIRVIVFVFLVGNLLNNKERYKKNRKICFLPQKLRIKAPPGNYCRWKMEGNYNEKFNIAQNSSQVLSTTEIAERKKESVFLPQALRIIAWISQDCRLIVRPLWNYGGELFFGKRCEMRLARDLKCLGRKIGKIRYLRLEMIRCVLL